jgi:Toprim domain
MAGGGVWFGSPSPTDIFVVGEGIETTLSAMILFEARAGVATLAANFLPAVLFPMSVERVLIAADHDGPESRNIDFRKAAYAADIWRKEGYEVALKRPREPGTDFNDILRKRRGVAL